MVWLIVLWLLATSLPVIRVYTFYLTGRIKLVWERDDNSNRWSCALLKKAMVAQVPKKAVSRGPHRLRDTFTNYATIGFKISTIISSVIVGVVFSRKSNSSVIFLIISQDALPGFIGTIAFSGEHNSSYWSCHLFPTQFSSVAVIVVFFQLIHATIFRRG